MSDACCGGDVCDVTPGPAPRSSWGGRAQWWRLGLAGAGIGAGAAARGLSHPWISLAACLVALALSVVEPGRRALRAARARSLDINVLMVIAVAGAAALGDYVEAAAVVWLFNIAEWLEARSLDRARHAIRSLMSLAPAVALVRRPGGDRQIPVAEVAVGDCVVVRPGERLPVDGAVVAGESAVNEAPVTGESWPADKRPGDAVFAGSINGAGALEVEVRRPASDSTIARIIHLVEAEQQRRAPIQTFVDRFARRYTPAVTALAVALAVVPPAITVAVGAAGWGQAFGVWTYRALAMLVVACPCALVISTPVSIVSALTAAARQGVLIKGGAHLERLGALRCVAFDKTGTLTRGRVTVTHVLGVDGVSTDGVLSVAAALESRSEHPIGRAIVDEAREAGVAVAPGAGFRALPGLGAEATVAEAPALVGSHRLFEERRLCTPALHARLDEVTDRGATAVLVGHDGAALGVIGLTDEMRTGSRDAIAALRRQGIHRIVLLTGDTSANARTLGEAAGLDEAHGDLLPADKMRQVDELRARYGPVAMVGDGVNDAPALAAADIGVAMGAAGSDVALETADVALMADDLQKLSYAVRLGRTTLGNVRANVALAVGLKLAFVGLAAAGLATLWMAILADTGASLLVTANSLRLLRVR
jgi:Zn2+/Cd2+-exporting ATPase